jgi:hypothetical protein
MCSCVEQNGCVYSWNLQFSTLWNEYFELLVNIVTCTGGVTKDMGFGLVTGFKGHFQLFITIRCGAIANSHSLRCTRARTESSRSAVSSPVLW